MINNPVFIICYGRSGSTLLTCIIDNHKQIKLTHENNIVYRIVSSGYRITDNANYNQFNEIINPNKLNSFFFNILMDKEIFEQLLTELKKNNLPWYEIYERLIRSNCDKPIWGENSFLNAFCLDELRKKYPKSVFIHLVRDPRDTALSFFRKKRAKKIQGVPYTNKEQYSPNLFMDWARIAIYSKRWEYWNSAIIRQKDLLPNYLLIRYEDLIYNYEETLTKCFNQIGVDYYPEVLNMSDTRKKLSKRSPYDNLGNQINNSSISQFHNMHTALINCVEKYAPGMKYFNYQSWGKKASFYPHWFFEKWHSKMLNKETEKIYTSYKKE